MSSKMRAISFFFLRLATPTGRASAAATFAVLVILIHLLSLAMEYVVMGNLAFPAVQRFTITAGAAAPFLALALFGFTMARESRQKLKELALSDTLTGLPNRRAFFNWIEEARIGKKRGFLVILDADRFKQVNDTLGHDAGDRALLAIADWMKRRTGPDIQFARVGGEEFGVLITGAPAKVLLASIETELCPSVVFTPCADCLPSVISLSAGSTVFDSARPTEEMLKEADSALYLAKAAGGARMRAFDAGSRAAPPAAHVKGPVPPQASAEVALR